MNEREKILLERKNYNRSYSGKVSTMYSSLKTRVKMEKHKYSTGGNFTIQEFRYFIDNKTDFKNLYKLWVESDFDRKLVPSIDRIDEKKGYFFENMQILTIADNIKKSHRFRKVDKKTYKRLGIAFRKPVIQMDLQGNFIARYNSASDATRKIKILGVSQCANGTIKTCGGFTWKYDEQGNDSQKECNCKNDFLSEIYKLKQELLAEKENPVNGVGALLILEQRL